MSASPSPPPTGLELRIKAGAALTCDLSTRVGATGATDGPDARRAAAFADRESRHPWLRRIGYFGLAVAIAIPWVLLLADQLSG